MNQNNLEKRLKMVNKPKHKEPTNYEHCCSCCIEQEKRIKHLGYTLNLYKKRVKNYVNILDKRVSSNDINPV